MSSSIPPSDCVTDTMGLVLRLENRKMGSAARAAFENAEAGETTLYMPSMVFAEVLYLSEKGRIQVSLDDVAHYLQIHPTCREYPLSLAVIQNAARLTDIAELHDRLIAATAALLELPLITNDPVIAASDFVKTFWA